MRIFIIFALDSFLLHNVYDCIATKRWWAEIVLCMIPSVFS